jgi:hypothetical protein
VHAASVGESWLIIRCACICTISWYKSLIIAKWRHVVTLGKGRISSQLGEYRRAQNSWRDLQQLLFCSSLAYQLIHCGIRAACEYVMHVEMQSSWMNVLNTTDRPSLTRWQRTAPARAAIKKLNEYMEQGDLRDSPKILALYKLIREKEWLREWEQSKRVAEESKRQMATSDTDADPAAPLISGVTVILVHSISLAHLLQLLLSEMVKCSILDGPIDAKKQHNETESQRL